MVRNECCLAERNSAHVLVSAGISRLLDTRLSGIHSASYIDSIVCAVILVCGSRVLAYGIQPTLGPSILSVIAKSLRYSGPSYPSSPVLKTHTSLAKQK